MSAKGMRSSEELKDFYAGEYVENYARTHTPIRIERLLKHVHLRRDDAVADFACGDGMLMPYVAPRVASYVGVDFSEEFIKKANERRQLLGIQNAEFHTADINAFCDGNQNRFDRAFALDFSEHVYDGQWLEILASIRNALKAGGSLYVHTPNSLFFVEQMKKHSIFLTQAPQHVAVRSPSQNIELLRRAGFRIERVELTAHYNPLGALHVLSHIPILGRYFQARIFIDAVK